MGGWCESLEARCLLSSQFTPQEVYLAELVNRARSDPAVEAVRLGFDLTEGLTAEQLDLFGAVEPLALDASLTAAARAHSLDMRTRGFFDHVNPDGQNPTQRAKAAGYSGVAGEDIGAGMPNVDRLYESWMSTVENRMNILSLLTSFTSSFHYDQLGPGFATDVRDDEYYTLMLGDPGAGSTARLVGVVYDDADADEFYTIGEGASGVRVDVADAGAPDTVVATFTTDDAGNYQILLGDGSWIVTFTDVATGDLVEKQVTTAGQNVKLDALVSELAPPANDGGSGGGDGGSGGNDGGSGGGDGGSGGNDGGSGGGSGGEQDDHADDGDYPNATLITLDDAGAGDASGSIGTGSDTDLFYLTSPLSGAMTLVLDTSSGSLVGSLTLKSDAGLALAFDAAASGETSVTIVWNVPAGAQYFLVVGSADQAATGAYTLTISIDDGSGGGDGGSGGSDGGSGGNDGGSGGSDGGSGGSDGGSGGSDGGSGGNDGGSGGSDGGSDGDDSPQDEDPPVDATSDGSGAFTIVRTDDNGRPIVYLQQADGSWLRVDLIAEAGGPTPEGRFSTFVDPVSGRSSIVSATASGLAVYEQDASGGWRVRNLSAELGVAPIASKPVTFTTRKGLVYMAGLDESGDLVVYRHTGELDGEGRRAWAFGDLTSDDLASQGMTMPALKGGTLIAYVTGWNGLTIAGLDADGNVQAAWWSPGMEKWKLANLSTVTGAPKYQGSISAYLTPWNGINIAGTDVNGDLSVVWWVPSFGGKWSLSKLNRMFDGPAFVEGSVASWVTPWGGLNISGLTAEGKVVVYWWTPTSGGWKITPLSDYISNVDPPARGVIGHTSETGVISVMGLSEAGDLVRYWWQPGAKWTGEDLSL